MKTLIIFIISIILLFLYFKNKESKIIIIENNNKINKHFKEGPYKSYNYQPPENIYENIGYVYNENKRFQLFGRETFYGSKKFEYFIQDENKIKIPIKMKLNQDCSPCKKEIEDGQIIFIDSMNPNEYTVKLYDIKSF